MKKIIDIIGVYILFFIAGCFGLQFTFFSFFNLFAMVGWLTHETFMIGTTIAAAILAIFMTVCQVWTGKKS